MRKKTKKKKLKKNNNKFYIAIIFVLLILVFSGGFYLGYLLQNKKLQKEKTKIDETLTKLKNKIESLQKENSQIKTKLKHSKNIENSEIEDYKNALKIVPPPTTIIKPQISEITKKIEKSTKTQKPKLILIIDDMSFKYQVNLLKQIPYKITPSFFPPTKIHPNTPKLASEFSHYMVHVPMQAISFKHPEPKTLNIGDSFTKIYNRLVYIKKTFPNAKFINNHTGSKFTSDTNSMLKLFKALKELNLGFVDSVTTPNTKSKIAENYYHIPLYRRNIFLDNKEDPNYIKNQLKKAIHLAKKYGYAIAIGHPHKVTLLTLKNSKDLLNQVEVVYIDELNKSR